MKKLMFATITLVSLGLNAGQSSLYDITGPAKYIKSTPQVVQGVEGRKIELCKTRFRTEEVCTQIGPKRFYTIDELEETLAVIERDSSNKASKVITAQTGVLATVGAVAFGALTVASGGVPVIALAAFGAATGSIFGLSLGRTTRDIVSSKREDFLVHNIIEDKNITVSSDKIVEEFAKLISVALKETVGK